MSVRLIIDGYNLMHAVGLARGKLVGKQLEGARARLLRRLAYQLSKDERALAIVVFDAKTLIPVSTREELIEGFRVLYPEPGHEADELIEQLIAQDPQPRKLRIVSSDRRLHRAARERMAASVNCDKFLDELDDRRPAPTDPPPVAKPTPDTHQTKNTSSTKTVSQPPVDVNYWMKEFGDVEIPEEVDLPLEGIIGNPVPNETETPLKGQSRSDAATKPASTSSAQQPLQIPLPKQPGIVAAPLKQKPARLRRESNLDSSEASTTAQSEPERKDPELEFWEQELKTILDEERRRPQ